MENQVWYYVAHSSPRYSRSGTVQPTRVQKSSKCYGPNVRKVTPGVLHHLVNHTFQHTSTHIIQKQLRNETKRLEKEEQHMKKT